MTLAKWVKQYELLVQRTRFVSQLAAFWFALLAILEVASLATAVCRNSTNLGEYLFWESMKAGTLLIAIFIAFSIRFALFYRMPVGRYIFLPISWFAVATLLTIYIALFDHGFWFHTGPSYGVYSLSQIDPFIIQGPMFICLGAARFVITAVFALERSK
ncbi:MAG: hypothetical protein ABI999_02145 [Acidobacteriota bacterium]